MPGSLDHSPADIMRYLLIDLELGTLPTDSEDWPISVTQEVEDPDNAITLFDTSGTRQGRVFGGEIQEHEGFQVRIRATSHPIGQTKANAIKEALDKSILNVQVAIEGTTYIVHSVSRRSGIFYLGQDVTSSKRVIFTINAVVALRQTN